MTSYYNHGSSIEVTGYFCCLSPLRDTISNTSSLLNLRFTVTPMGESYYNNKYFVTGMTFGLVFKFSIINANKNS